VLTGYAESDLEAQACVTAVQGIKELGWIVGTNVPFKKEQCESKKP
jgi:hypothetical protein